MQLTIHTGSAVPEVDKVFWERAGRRQDPALYFTRSPAWLAFMSRGISCSTACAHRSDGTPIALCPLMPGSWTLGVSLLGAPLLRRSLRIVRMFGGDMIDEGLSDSERTEILDRLAETFPDAAGLLWTRVPQGGRSERLLAACRGSRAWLAYTLHPGLPHYRLLLPATVEECHGLRSSKTVNKILGRERAMGRELGASCRIVELRDLQVWMEHVESIVSLMRNSWQARLLGHEFGAESASDLAARGWLRSFLLLAGDQPAAFAFCYQVEGTLVYDSIGYDQRFAKFSPGIILLYRMLDQLYEHDTPRYVDFGEGEADYKQQLATERIDVNAFILVRRSVSHRIQFALMESARCLDRQVRKVLSTVGIKKRLMRIRVPR